MNEFMIIEDYKQGDLITTNFDDLDDARAYQEELKCNSSEEDLTVSLVYIYQQQDGENNSIDEMTVIVDDYYIYGMSYNAVGFNQFCGELDDRYECDGRLECNIGKLVDMNGINDSLFSAVLDRCKDA